MRKLMIIPALLALTAIGCNKGSNNPGGGSNPPEPDPEPEVLTTTVVFSEIGLENDQEFISYTINDLTISGDIGGNTSNVVPKYFTSDSTLRIYLKNTLTFSGTSITEIVFNSNNASYTANVGELSGKNWTGSDDIDAVTFTATQQVRITSVTVTHIGIEGGGGGDPTSTRTTDTIANDISTLLDGAEISKEGNERYIAILIENATSLADACNAGCYYLDQLQYLVFDEDSGLVEDTWEDESSGVFCWYLDEDYESNGLVVEIGSWEETSGEYAIQFCVYIDEQ